MALDLSMALGWMVGMLTGVGARGVARWVGMVEIMMDTMIVVVMVAVVVVVRMGMVWGGFDGVGGVVVVVMYAAINSPDEQ